jgi:hypothetical protein
VERQEGMRITRKGKYRQIGKNIKCIKGKEQRNSTEQEYSVVF